MSEDKRPPILSKMTGDQQKEYHVEGKENRSATIVFVKAAGYAEYKFKSCDFLGVNRTHYSFEDWEFLHGVSEFIIQLQKDNGDFLGQEVD